MFFSCTSYLYLMLRLPLLTSHFHAPLVLMDFEEKRDLDRVGFGVRDTATGLSPGQVKRKCCTAPDKDCMLSKPHFRVRRSSFA